MSSADYEHPELGVEKVQTIYDRIFFGPTTEDKVRLPFKFVSVALNGTTPLPTELDHDMPITTDTRFGVFVNPDATAVDYVACLVTDDIIVPSYDAVLKTVGQSFVASRDERAAMSVVRNGGLMSAASLRKMYAKTVDERFPLAVISGWHYGIDGVQDENICMHYPAVVDPMSMLSYMQRAAARERMILAVDDVIPVDIVTPSESDVTIYCDWSETAYY